MVPTYRHLLRKRVRGLDGLRDPNIVSRALRLILSHHLSRVLQIENRAGWKRYRPKTCMKMLETKMGSWIL